ncbi:haloacid dehalogenase type II [Marinobacterium stanieri]|uniref:(S)-2-haloacid dehalogenase n=1 Tax=Marinobacterium stanieri TaxID=49186 RepID=A0A1N6R242_9GAMM|nr:haloacid dehalogenase type II [Marinobacterium stanieri]SIQ22931.1 2-haloacid dehalogenase [Marinobacterium stanieri]
MAVTLAFDVYGTLIDPRGVVVLLEQWVGDLAEDFAQTWREKQLEYAFRRGLMRHYADFAVCTRQALDYTCMYFDQALTDEQKRELLAFYRQLPVYEDAAEALKALQEDGFRLYAFSNGARESVQELLENAGIREYFQGIVSVEEQRSFKPDPGVYSYFLRQAKASNHACWLISGNPFDVIGAISAGMKGAWVQRSPRTIFDPWGVEPTLTVRRLSELSETLKRQLSSKNNT